jgi:hypothetical protein
MSTGFTQHLLSAADFAPVEVGANTFAVTRQQLTADHEFSPSGAQKPFQFRHLSRGNKERHGASLQELAPALAWRKTPVR